MLFLMKKHPRPMRSKMGEDSICSKGVPICLSEALYRQLCLCKPWLETVSSCGLAIVKRGSLVRTVT